MQTCYAKCLSICSGYCEFNIQLYSPERQRTQQHKRTNNK